MLNAKPPTVKIKGPPAREDVRHENGYSYYPMRQIYVEDTHDVMQIVNIGMYTGQVDVASLDLENLTNTNMALQLIKVLFAASGGAKEEFLRLYASLIDVPVSMFRVPRKADGRIDREAVRYFPPNAPFTIIGALIKHEDFLEIVSGMGNDLGAMVPEAQSSTSQEQ